MVKKVFFTLSLLFLLVGCSRQSTTIIDWVDFIQLKGEKYIALYDVIADPTFIKEEISKVKFELDGNVHDPSYKTKDGDAAYLAKGTIIYEVEGYPDYSIIAVKDNNKLHGYKLYKSKKSKLLNYKNLPKNDIRQIEIYLSNGLKPTKKVKVITGNEIKAFIRILDKGSINASYSPNTAAGDPEMYDIFFYTNGSIALQETIFYDGQEYYWYTEDITILNKEIEKYLK